MLVFFGPMQLEFLKKLLKSLQGEAKTLFRMVRTVILTIIFATLILSNTHAQYKITSNNKVVLEKAAKAESSDPAIITANNFFDLAKSGNRSEWDRLLAKNCYKDGLPRDFANRWFDQIACHNKKYSITETASPKTNQKIFYYGSQPGGKNPKSLVLVKEKGELKIYYANL
jgi:hypothetical protein